MLEILMVIGAIVLVAAIAGGLLKLLFSLILLPFKLGLWIVKGVFAVLIVIPAVILAVCALSAVLPVVLVVIAVPFLCVVAAFAFLLDIVF